MMHKIPKCLQFNNQLFKAKNHLINFQNILLIIHLFILVSLTLIPNKNEIDFYYLFNQNLKKK